MLYTLPFDPCNSTSIKSVGRLAYDLNSISRAQSCFKVEASIVISTESFEEYRQNRILPDKLVDDTVCLLDQFQMESVMLYPSFYEDCLVEDRPIKLRVSTVNIRNAVTAIYERWSDAKPYAQRKIRNLIDADTYPAILIQPSIKQELTTITRHPSTGELMHGDAGQYLVHCSDVILDSAAEEMIRVIDSLTDLPVKIYYTNDSKTGGFIIRRINEFPLTTQVKLNHVLAKLQSNSITPEKAILLINPEDIASETIMMYQLTACRKYKGLRTDKGQAQGPACFPWSESVPEGAILLCKEVSLEDIPIMKKCGGCVTCHGGIYSHAAEVFRGMGKPCIIKSRDLVIDNVNKKAYTSDNDEIHEGDNICLLDDQWTHGGELLPGSEYKAVCSRETLKKLNDVLIPFTNVDRLDLLPLKEQFHISLLIKTMKGIGFLR